MSWHFSQALAEAYWAARSLGGSQSAPLKSTGTEGGYSWQGRTTERCRFSQFGTTSGHSTVLNGADVLTWYLAVSPARHIPRQLEAATRRMIFGRKCGESWQRSLPGTYLQRTLHALPSTQRPTTLKRWATKPAALPFPRETWVLTTFGLDIGCVHTPTTKANYAAKSMQKWPGCRAFVKAFGAPIPEVHEWLMDWPEGWTDLKPLAMDKWQSWLQRHGACSASS
jgi:hypothetical protein